MTSAQLAALARKTRERMASARQAIGNRGFEWYPYDSLGNLPNLERMLGARYLDVLDRAAGKQVADIGCGDGDLAFLMESLGCEVDAIDFPVSNHNGMEAIRALKRQLQSGITIEEIDLDSQFQLPRKKYDLILFWAFSIT